jgi:cytochrome P450
MDFFIAGAIPIGATLDFLVLMMLLHPDVQQKAQKEIDAVVGKDRLPQLTDKPQYVAKLNNTYLISIIGCHIPKTVLFWVVRMCSFMAIHTFWRNRLPQPSGLKCVSSETCY